jgi:hypothetical protein
MIVTAKSLNNYPALIYTSGETRVPDRVLRFVNSGPVGIITL